MGGSDGSDGSDESDGSGGSDLEIWKSTFGDLILIKISIHSASKFEVTSG